MDTSNNIDIIHKDNKPVIISPGKMATTAIKKIVSKKKRRFESEGFNLDLSYVTERVIAMGYPASEHVEAIYRNSLEDVRR